MKVLIFNTLYYPNFIGGAEKSVQLLAEGFIKEGHEVHVFSNGYNEENYELNGVKIKSFKTRNIYNFLSKKNHNALLKLVWHILDTFNLFYFFRIYRLIKKIKPDIIFTNNLSGFSVIIWPIARLLKIPVYHTIRDYYLMCPSATMFKEGSVCNKQCLKCMLLSYPKKILSKSVTGVIGISNYVLEKHLQNGYFANAEFKSVINNSLKEFQYSNIEKKNCVDEDAVVFGYIGRLSEDKGIEYLLTNFLKVITKNKCKVKLIIGGVGKERYTTYLMERFSSSEIIFCGKVEPNSFYQSIDYLIVPSLWDEPFGRVVIEALQNHVPVIANNVGGLSELSDYGNIEIIDNKNTLNSVLCKYIKERPRFDYEKWEKVEELFCSDTVINKYLEIFKKKLDV